MSSLLDNTQRNVHRDKANFLQSVANFEVKEIDADYFDTELFVQQIMDANLFLLGEAHGVLENPLIIYMYFKKFGFNNLALDWGKNLEPMLDKFLLTGEIDFDAIKDSSDGKITAGHFAVMKKLHEEGELEKVLCIDTSSSDDTWDTRDAIMAAEVHARITDKPTLVVAGSQHVLTNSIAFDDGTWHVPMGEHIKNRLPHVPSGRIDYLKGEFYNMGLKDFPEGLSSNVSEITKPRFFRNEEGLYIFELPLAHAAFVPNP